MPTFQVPIYKGATTQFIKYAFYLLVLYVLLTTSNKTSNEKIRSTPVKENTWDESVFFGKDGIGGQPTAFPEVAFTPDIATRMLL